MSAVWTSRTISEGIVEVSNGETTVRVLAENLLCTVERAGSAEVVALPLMDLLEAAALIKPTLLEKFGLIC